MRRYTTKMLVTLALLSAIGVILARFIVPMPNPYMRFSIEAVPFIVAGFLYGPIPGALVGFVADFVGCLFSGYGYNPVFAVPPVLIGLCAGLMRPLLYKKVTYFRILGTFIPAVIVGSVIYKACIQAAISLGLPANLLKLITAALFLVILAVGTLREKGGARHA